MKVQGSFVSQKGEEGANCRSYLPMVRLVVQQSGHTSGKGRTEVTDRPVNLGCVIACCLWGVTVGALLVSLFERDVYLATVACAASAAAATATVRTYFVYSNRLIRNAFELGRDSAILNEARVQRVK